MLSTKVISQNKYDNELILLSKNKSDFNRSKIILEKAKQDLSDTILKANTMVGYIMLKLIKDNLFQVMKN